MIQPNSTAQLLREYADAVDKDRGFATGLTHTMRDAASELENITIRADERRIMRDEKDETISQRLREGTTES